MRKSVPFILVLLFTISLFWGCDDDKTVTITSYLPVNFREVIDTINLEVYDFVKKDTIFDTASSDTAYSTSSAALDYGTVLYSMGVFTDSLKEISVDRQHIRNAVVLRYLEIYDTISSDTASDTVIIDSDTVFYDSVFTIDSTKSELSDSTIILTNTVFDTVITSNNSFLMSINGASTGYVGLGYLMYGDAEDASISGLKNVTSNSTVICKNSSVFIASGNQLSKISSSFVIDSTFQTDTIVLSNIADFIVSENDSIVYVLDSVNKKIIKIDAAGSNFSTLDTITFTGSATGNIVGLSSSIILIVNDSIKMFGFNDSITIISNSKKAPGQLIAGIDDSLLVVLSPKEEGIARGALEIINLSGATDTSLGVIKSARYVPAGLSDMNFISANTGYVLDKDAGILYKISYANSSLGSEEDVDFLTEVASNVSSYTFDEKNLFISTNDGELQVFNLNDLNTVVKKAEISGGAANSMSILTK